MASGHRHWRTRLAALGRLPSLRRSQRRQLRKLLGRAWGLEWRIPGHPGRFPPSAWSLAIVERARKVGHVARRLAERRNQS